MRAAVALFNPSPQSSNGTALVQDCAPLSRTQPAILKDAWTKDVDYRDMLGSAVVSAELPPYGIVVIVVEQP